MYITRRSYQDIRFGIKPAEKTGDITLQIKNQSLLSFQNCRNSSNRDVCPIELRSRP